MIKTAISRQHAILDQIEKLVYELGGLAPQVEKEMSDLSDLYMKGYKHLDASVTPELMEQIAFTVNEASDDCFMAGFFVNAVDQYIDKWSNIYVLQWENSNINDVIEAAYGLQFGKREEDENV